MEQDHQEDAPSLVVQPDVDKRHTYGDHGLPGQLHEYRDDHLGHGDILHHVECLQNHDREMPDGPDQA